MLWAVHRDVPSDAERTLTAWERAYAARLRAPSRRRDFVHGRWTVKRLVAALLEEEEGRAVELDAIEVERDGDGVPRVHLLAPWRTQPAVSVSLSHRGGAVLAAATSGQLGIGADMELIEERSRAMVEDFFVDEEVATVDAAADPHLVANTIWSAKEAVLKALHLGLSVDTRQVACRVPVATATWQEVGVEYPRSAAWRPVRCWCRRLDRFVLTLACTGDRVVSLVEHTIPTQPRQVTFQPGEAHV